jgi:protein glucosyltransferase
MSINPYVDVPGPSKCRYKFLVHLDGITASYRLYKLMHADSPVLKQESPYREHFTRSLKPYTHFIPIFK